jgi:hypothetical protein
MHRRETRLNIAPGESDAQAVQRHLETLHRNGVPLEGQISLAELAARARSADARTRRPHVRVPNVRLRRVRGQRRVRARRVSRAVSIRRVQSDAGGSDGPSSDGPPRPRRTAPHPDLSRQGALQRRHRRQGGAPLFAAPVPGGSLEPRAVESGGGCSNSPRQTPPGSSERAKEP